MQATSIAPPCRSNLLSLPPELNILIPNYLHSLDDLYSLIRTCRTFYKTCASSSAQLAPDFAEKYGQPLLPPHPHLLLTGTARQIGDWAVRNEDNRRGLSEAIQSGNDGLLKLAIEVARLSLEDVRRIYKSKLDIINPVSRILDWDIVTGRSQRECVPDDLELWSICEDVERAVYKYLIYCELFHHCIDKALKPSLPITPLSQKVRQCWMGYCLPEANKEGENVDLSSHLISFVILTKAWASRAKVSELLFAKSPRRLGRYDNTEYDTLAPQEKLLVNGMAHQGLATVQMLLPGGMEAIKDLIASVRQSADAVPSTQIQSDPIDIRTEVDSMHVTWFSIFQDAKCSFGIQS